jgi:starch synthase
MPAPRRILLLSAEVAPFAKTGGLGDVAGALPKALAAMGHDVRVVMPAYQAQERAAQAGDVGFASLPDGLTVHTGGGPLRAGVLQTALPGSDVPLYLVAESSLFDRPNIYGYDDDPYRFAFFSRAALQLTAALGWRPDVVHAHDWHAAPAVMWLDTSGRDDGRFRGMATVFTIHNLAHQGRSSRRVLRYLEADGPPLLEEGGWDEVNFMARGIYHATQVNTVSPTYAKEIMTPDGGSGLDPLLRARRHDVTGILNGLDVDVWNPATDLRLAQNFDAAGPEARVANKLALQSRLGLEQGARIPLIAMVTRLDAQKGMEITGHVIHLLMSGQAGDVQFVVLGTGAKRYEDALAHMAGYHPRKMAAVLTFASDLAPQIYAASDVFLMPSLFEPCGLGQMIAMRFGSVPVVRSTGGLADTVRDGQTGFTFEAFTADALWIAVQRALLVYNTDPDEWVRLRRNGMSVDFSWSGAARGYVDLYERALARAGGHSG